MCLNAVRLQLSNGLLGRGRKDRNKVVSGGLGLDVNSTLSQELVQQQRVVIWTERLIRVDA